MLPQSDLEIENIPGVGEKLKLSFNKLGVYSFLDLIHFLPREVLDLSQITQIKDVRKNLGENIVIESKVKKVSIIRSKIKRMWLVEAKLEDSTGMIEAIWFNQPFVHKNLKKEEKYFFYGTVVLNNDKAILNNPQIYNRSGIFPIYKQTKGLTTKMISRIITRVIKPSLIPKDIIPENVLKKNHLPDFFSALQKVHLPKTESEFKSGRYRFLFEELFIFSLTNQFIKNKFKSQNSYKFKINKTELKTLIDSLPYNLTKDQNQVLQEVCSDLSSIHPMNRLLQGDVGSGKTIIAFLATIIATKNDFKSILMAPTEILAVQHFQTFSNLVEQVGLKNIKISLVTAKSKNYDKDADIFIGTHALINRKFEKLALVIVDEQQRFGVEQRNKIIEKNRKIPHYLSLSATPIPRSLFHTIFSSLDLSVIHEKPKNRKPIKTYLVTQSKRNDSYQFVNDLIAQNQQVFIVCPLINENLESRGENFEERKAVTQELERLKKTVLGSRRIALLHGRLSSEQKEKIMLEFQNKKIDVLVSTSVIEVGIDIENATVIIIEDADSFGLSQLHQFRGRVGRGQLDSYCFIFSKKIANPQTRERLKAFVQNQDGFKLANFDLKQRGPGTFFDMDQSGFKGINPLWFENSKLLKDATEAARELVSNLDQFPHLKAKIEGLAKITHLE